MDGPGVPHPPGSVVAPGGRGTRSTVPTPGPVPPRMATVLSMLALAAGPSAPERPLPAARHPGCNTPACDRRMTTRAHARTRRRWQDTTRPYRGWLASVRWCESRGRYTINTGNGYFGAYQFTLRSWLAVRGRGMPHLAEPLEQDYRAVRLLWLQGPGAWPVCG